MARQVTLDETNLEWQTFDGSIPDGAVSIYNEYEKRTDYVAKVGIHTGFYCPDLDQYCHHALGGKELLCSQFEILVNKDDFESLEWKDGSYGSVPPNSVYTSPNDMYVGKNQYGLGKVDVRNKAFFLAWKGKEYWYKNYQVLTFKTDVISEHISDVKYKTDDLKTIKYPPEALTKSPIINNTDQPVTHTVTLSKATEVEQRWDTSFSMTVGVKVGFTAGIPLIGESEVEVSTEETFQYSMGTARNESTTHSVTVSATVPPHHSRSVTMVAYKYGADIPYTARLQRTYRNRETRWTSIDGTYKGVSVGEVRSVVDPCVSLSLKE